MNTLVKVLEILQDNSLDAFERLLKLYDALGVAVLFLDKNRKNIRFNKFLVKLTGYTEKEIKQKDVLDFLFDDYKSLALSKFLSKSDVPYEMKARKKNGEVIDILVQGKNLVVDGEEMRIVAVKDLTTQRNLERDNSMLRKAIEELRESIVITDVDGNILYINRFFEENTGYSREEAIGQNPRILKSGFHPQEFYKELWDTILSGKTWQGEFLNRRKDGSLFWERAIITPFVDDESKVSFFIAGKQDITKEKKYQEEVEISKNRYKKLIETSPLAILTFNTQGEIEIVNRKMVEFLGSPSAEETRKINMLTFGRLKAIGVTEKFRESIRERKYIIHEGRYVSKWGKEVYYKLHINPVVGSGGEVDTVVIVAEDISKQKEYENAILEAKEKAERNDKLKNLFLANISHELRTPLNGILGFSDLLRNDDGLNEEQKEFVELIYQSGTHLLRLINDLLSISKIEAGAVVLSPEKIRIGDLVNQILKVYSEQISAFETTGVEFVVRRHKDIDNEYIEIDVDRVLQVIRNLINNAFKFTNKGSVIFDYRISDRMLKFYVKDTGIGIPVDKRDIIFEKFRQANENYTGKYEGSGLGLYIAKKLVDLMKGKIYFESEEGVGTTFYVEFPLLVAEKESEEATGAVSNMPDLKDKRIVVVEDDMTNIKLIDKILGCDGKWCVVFNNGKQVVDYVKAGNRPDLILMDIRVPEIDGIEATRIIKSMYPQIKIIMQTAHAYEDEMEKAYKAGCDGYLTKPFTRDELYEAIKRVLHL